MYDTGEGGKGAAELNHEMPEHAERWSERCSWQPYVHKEHCKVVVIENV